MVSGKPPRHSRPKNDPVTIDLEAREEVRNDEAAKPFEGEAISEPATGASDTSDPATVPEGMVEAAPEEPAVEAGSRDMAPQSETISEQTAPASPKETDQADVPPANPTGRENPGPTTRPSPAFSSLAAAGILGGLIALLGAGALQYGGVLPALGPDRSASADASPLASDVAALKNEVARLAAQPASTADSGLDARLASLEAALAAAPQDGANSADLQALEAALDRSTQDIAALKSELASLRQSQTDSATAIETRLSEAETKLDAPRQDVSMAHAIAVAALKTAIDRGGPFLGELNTLAGVKPDDPAVAALQPYAAVGIPSRAELTRRVAGTADAILAAVNQPDPNLSWSDRLMSSAMSVVKVRPVGNVDGDSPEAIVARMEDKLRNGDLKGASLELDTLPDAGKAAAEDFRKQLQTRIEVETIVSTALTDAVDGKG